MANASPPDIHVASPASALAPTDEPAAEASNVTWQQAQGRHETCAALEALPDKIEFPEDFPEPIRFDPANSRLIYRGFMSATSYRFLQKLSRDLAYMHAIEQLSMGSVGAIMGERPGRRPWFWPAVVACAIAIAGVVAWIKWH